MITNVLVRPNPFSTSFTMEITCEQSKHTIVRLFNPEGRIIKMFSWFLIKGTNITNITELGLVKEGVCRLDILDNEGNLLHTLTIAKEVVKVV